MSFVSFVVPAGAQTSQGPLVLEPMDNGFVLAPEVKFTKLADDAATLAGAYGGWIKDRHFLVGGALYGLTDDQHGSRGLAYGGVLLGWFFAPDRPVSASARSLVGFGHVSETFSDPGIPYCLLPEEYLCSIGPHRVPAGRHRASRDFVFLEPEIQVQARVTDRIHLGAGGGYRIAGDMDRRRAPNPRGPTGSLSVQFRF